MKTSDEHRELPGMFAKPGARPILCATFACSWRATGGVYLQSGTLARCAAVWVGYGGVAKRPPLAEAGAVQPCQHMAGCQYWLVSTLAPQIPVTSCFSLPGLWKCFTTQAASSLGREDGCSTDISVSSFSRSQAKFNGRA